GGAPGRRRTGGGGRCGEAICGKRGERGRARRYGWAEALADDLRRFLEDEPIHARPPTLTQKLGRWARRHRTLATSAGVLIVMALLSGGGAVWWAQRQGIERLRQGAGPRRAVEGGCAASA